MDKIKLNQKLFFATSNLEYTPKGFKSSVDSIRSILAYNLKNGLQDVSIESDLKNQIQLKLEEEENPEFKKYFKDQLDKENPFLLTKKKKIDSVPIINIRKDENPLPFNFLNTTTPEWRWNEIKGEEIGPLYTDEGRLVWLDFIYYEDKLTVRKAEGNQPYFLFSKAKRNIWETSFNTNNQISLSEGHVWIWSKLLSGTADDNSYVGFTIKGGSFIIENDKSWEGDFLNVNGDFSGSLELELKQPNENTVSFEGCKAAQSIILKYPDTIKLVWDAGTLTTIESGDASFKDLNNEISVSNFNLPIKVENELNHLFIPCTAQPTKWEYSFTQSQTFSAEGSADIDNAYWAIPLVKVTNPSTLGEPKNNGGISLKLASDIRARWIGTADAEPDAILQKALVIIYPDSMLLRSKNSVVDTESKRTIDQKFNCWEIDESHPHRLPIHFSYKESFQLVYHCHALEGESLYSECYSKVQLDRPLLANGFAVEFESELKGAIWFIAKGAKVSIGSTLIQPNFSELHLTKCKLLALQNALLTITTPIGLSINGVLSVENRTDISSGQFTLIHGLKRWKPILPDPYVSNLREGWDARSQEFPDLIRSVLLSKVSWDEPSKPVVEFNCDLTLQSAVGIEGPQRPAISGLPTKIEAQVYEEVLSHKIDRELKGKKYKNDSVFEELEEQFIGWKLLDVSTNMDLIGVSVSPNLYGKKNRYFNHFADNDQSSQPNRFTVNEMAVNTPLTMVNVFTLPQVQWEPVQTLKEDQDIATLGWFPENLSSASDGGPTRLVGISQELSPIIPDVLVQKINNQFNEGEPAMAITTLSFGIKALVGLLPSNTVNRNADSIDITQPEFEKEQMKGGIQLTLKAEGDNPKHESPSPGFEGFMLQTLNGYELFTGTELGISVLGATLQSDASVESQFNAEFSPFGSNPFVPVTRFDLSGYGGSNFSDWENEAALASIGKVNFNITVGRTSFEVVKFVSKIYPWGCTVTRSVTIERKSGGGVIRKDSGWQATQSGILSFIVPDAIPNNPYEFSPGLFRGCFDIRNIRPVNDNIISFTDPDNGNPVKLAPVYFDANVQLDGQIEDSIPSQGVLGFIQLEPKPDTNVNPWMPQLLSKEALKGLINDQGAIGGPLDTTIQIGNSGLKFRVSRFEIDVVDNAGNPNFLGMLRGQPVLPNNGSWSVVKLPSSSNLSDPQESTSTDSSLGTPLFVLNGWNAPVGNAMNVGPFVSPYRFTDPQDIFGAQPKYDYGFMQNTGSQAFLFRRPELINGSNELTTSLKPVFAGPFAMFTTKGVFPPVEDAISFPSSNYKLLIENSTGRLKLNNALIYPNPRPTLTIAEEGVHKMVIEYDESELRYSLDYTTWNAELDTFYVWTSIFGLDKLFGNRFSLRAGSGQKSMFVDNMSLIKPEIRDALSFIPGFGDDSETKDIELGMTNAKHEVKINIGYQCKIILGADKPIFKCKPKSGDEAKPEITGPSIEFKFKGVVGLGLVNKEIDSDRPELGRVTKFALEAKAGAGLKAKIPVAGPVFIVLGLDTVFGLKILPDLKGKLELKAYAGLGFGFSLGCGKGSAFLAGGIVYKREGDKDAWLWLVLFEAGLDFKVVSVSLLAELQGSITGGQGVAYGVLAVNVSICFVINISISYDYHEKKNL